MENKIIEHYSHKLWNNKDSGKYIEFREIEIEDWSPLPKFCHDNVNYYCSIHRDCKPVKGWFFFDLDYAFPYVLFVSHTVVQDEVGDIFDITPADTFDKYQLIVLNEDKHFDFVVHEKGIHTIEYNIT